LWINIGPFFIRLRIQTADLKIWHDGHSEPGDPKDPEDPEKKRLQSLHQCPPPLLPSSGFKKVGTLAVRPKPSNIRLKWKAKMPCDTVSKIQESVRPRR